MGRTTNTQKTAEQKPKQEAKVPEQEPQQAAKAPEQEPQQAAKAPEQEPQQAAQEPEQEPQQEEPDGRVMVEVVQTYKDLVLNRIVREGECLPMLPERAAVIIGKKLGKAVEE